MASIPDISTVSYDVFGVVRTADAGYKATVALTHGPENVKPQKKHVDENGSFCFQVPSGDYRLSAMATTPENAPELVFLPPYVDVSVRSPLLNVEFSQVALRWAYEQGIVVVVKSSNKDRMKQNLEIFDWKLSSEDHEKIRTIPQAKTCTGKDFTSPSAPIRTIEELWDGVV